MTTRDRLALIGISSLALLAVVWLLLVSPERKQASQIEKQLGAANAQLASAEGEAANARVAQAHYAAAYASVVDLGKAVPPSEEVPSLIYQLAHASNQKHVEFSSIATSTPAGSSSSSASASTAAASAGGFTQMPFTFIFNGGFDDLYHLFLQLDKSTVTTASGLQVSGRLLTLQGVKLEPKAAGEKSAGLTGTITATAYVLPAGQSLTGGATPPTPTASGSAATTASSASPTSSSGSSGAPAAVVTSGAVR
jgi:Tfp pilus assembly protein PilO